LKRSGKSKSDEVFLKGVGRRIGEVIVEKGYDSPYDFWIKKADGQFSRQTLNYILTGRMDPKLTTLRAVAHLLKVDLTAFLTSSDD
jgi:hypothetical protein